jgi:hypothetical protein
MAKRLIATNFTYSALDPTNYRRVFWGSYLGQKRASRRTLREFVRRNGAEWKPRIVSIDDSYISQWIAK